MIGNAAWTVRDRTRHLAALLALFLLPAGLWAQPVVDPGVVTGGAIERLRFAQENFPAEAAEIGRVIDRLERSRVGTDGSALVEDSCHLRSAPAGLTAWIEARQAVLAIGRLLARDPNLSLAPALVRILTDVRSDLVEVYRFLAEVALQEARALGDLPSSGAQIGVAEEAFAQADQQLLTGDHGQAMQSLRQTWEHALLAVPQPETDDRRPILSIEQPLDGAVLFDSSIDVSGMVQLLITGTVGADDVTVSVNARPAEVVHRSFVAREVPLEEGLNALVAVAESSAGAVGSSCIAVVLDTTPRARIEAVSGTGQSAEIRTLLPEPLDAEVRDAAGDLVPGAQVVFRVIQGDGSLDGGRRSAVVETDAAGRAGIGFTLGSRAGVAVNRVRATAVGIEGEAVFAPTATTAPPESINPVSGDNQRGATGEPLAQPLVVVVTDAGQNPVEDAAVTFEVVEGGGSIQGASQAVVPSDPDGRAAARLTLGTEAGLDNQQVRATFPGLTNEPVVFKASALVTGDPADTRISGVVQDNQGDPVPGVTLFVAGTEIATTADAEGQFTLVGVPVGEVVLHADASTAARPGTWASLSFDLHTLPGVDNRLEKPIYILPLDLADGKVVGGPEDVTIVVPEVPGFSLTVLAGSATFPDGSRTGLVSVTPVHADKIPMAPGSGMQPRFIVTVQPAGVHFDPPAPVTFPNVDGLPPGTVAEMFSFDHDLAEFVSIGTGTVSEDGTVVRSDPGFGIVKAGWHCAAPQSGSGASAALSVSLSPDPIEIQLGEKASVTANGSPPRDGEYINWTVEAGELENTVSFTGQPSCMDQPSCPNELESEDVRITEERAFNVCGTATAKVTFRCKTTNKTVTGSATIEQGCGGQSAKDCKSICGSQRAQGMCGTPCELTGDSHPAFDRTLGACWRVNVGGSWFCYWDHRAAGGPGFINLCCPNRCFGASNIVWGQGPGNYLCTVIQSCTDPEFGGRDADGDPGVACTKVQ